ncbi:acetate--CoA ligase family protein [Streptomyces lincolnensis]|uniref:acetate--CoA ligase family protein n=1 Tax=Streptomyces lincolnensis TaxID=1915 RepID=UPI001E39AC3F|nr:acetate--CoA ligase family protein [Streptomyces lincolnensis]MCD7442689.1 acetate--CoA ligase family protein [Streptomyces lincolnensis]
MDNAAMRRATAPDTSSADALSQALLNPRSVAVVGASDNPAKTTGRPQRFLAQAGYGGRTYFVNPRRETVQGEKAWPSLTALPEAPEHVYIMTGAEAAIEAVQECARTGVRVATILSAGFGEDGEAGREREDRLRAAAAEGQVRLVGPSSLGVVNPRAGVMLTGNAAFGEPDIPRGGVFVASQSGSVIGSLVSRARGRGIGFAGLVSTGGEADLSLGAICRAVLDDPGVTSYALFLESLRHADDLADFAAAADRAGKPVAVYKLGRSQEAAALTVSHTGALAGEDSESEAFFTACGFSRVAHFESLLEAPALLRRLPAFAGRRQARVGVITTTGGGGAIVVDQLALRGLPVTAPSERLRDAMAAAGVPIPHSLIADIGLEGARHDSVTRALRLMQDSGEFDLIVFVIGSSARLNPELAVHAIAERGGHQVPVAAFALPEAAQAAELLHAAGVPAFRTPESCADVVAAAFARQPATIGGRAHPAVNASGEASVMDELASTELLRGQGVTPAPAVGLALDTLLDSCGPLDLPFDYPVVVKALSGKLPHKSDAGGVILNVHDADGIRDAARAVAVAVAAYDPDIVIDRVLVQQMVGSGVAEALVGYRVSQDVGPVVVLSTGGVLAELFADSAVRLAPVTRETALEMIREVKGLAPLSGHRGAPAGDIDALADTVVGISQLAVDHPGVLEAEVNPVSVGLAGKGVTALDALVRRAPVQL